MFEKTGPVSKKQLQHILARGQNTRVINLTETGANVKTLELLKKLLQRQSQAYHVIELYGNGIKDDSLIALRELVDMFTSIDTLKLEFNGITEHGAAFISGWLQENNNIKSIDLYENKIGDAGVFEASEMLRRGCGLEYLGLFGCGITNKGARYLIKALQTNTTIKKINLYNNEIDEEYVEIIDSMLSNNAGVKTLVPTLPNGEEELEDMTEFDEEEEEDLAPIQVRTLARAQPAPKLHKVPISKSKTKQEWEVERDKMVALLDKLVAQRKQLLTQQYKDNEYVFAEKLISPVVFTPFSPTTPSEIEDNLRFASPNAAQGHSSSSPASGPELTEEIIINNVDTKNTKSNTVHLSLLKV
ncbi:hypothetical protein AKO1_014336 [Acrasis kona]|uniref:RNI-like protein n=1 Tax=Acrasis kona TaxID=1008807 RepID=A0AAW2Z046_9EUKA